MKNDNKKVKPLTQKAIHSILNTGYLNVWEGAVRSGKTVASSLSWIGYVAASSEKYFIMSGKTIAALYRNVIAGDYGMLAMLGKGGEYKTDREGNRLLIVHTESGDKTCYCFGANDERAYSKMRGITAGGWYADEVNLQPRSFIDEAFRRTIVSSDRKNFWTLNPDNPYHFIYTDYLDEYTNNKLDGFHLWHFTLDDNLAIPDERKEELKKQYSGVFYRRYILGERCLAEGVIYDMLTDENFYDDSTRPENLEHVTDRTIAVDYGTTNPCIFLDIYDDGEIIWVDNEYRWDSKKANNTQKTDAQYAEDMKGFMGQEYQCSVIVDPSAASFKLELRNQDFYVVEGKNDVLNGIRLVSSLLNNNQIKINKDKCQGLIAELNSYSWDEKGAQNGEEKPIKQLDHAPDALRYFCSTRLPAWRVGITQ